MPEEPVHQDFRQSEAGKRQSWHGAKRLVKSFLGLRVPNALMRSAVRLKPGVNARGRLPAPRHVKEVEGSVGGTSFTMLRPDVCIIAKELYWGSGSRPAPSDQYALTSFVRLAGSVDVAGDRIEALLECINELRALELGQVGRHSGHDRTRRSVASNPPSNSSMGATRTLTPSLKWRRVE